MNQESGMLFLTMRINEAKITYTDTGFRAATGEFSGPEQFNGFAKTVVAGDETSVTLILTNRKNKPYKVIPMGKGTDAIDEITARRVFTEAIRHSAAALLIAVDSKNTENLTLSTTLTKMREIRGASKKIGIDMLDVIVFNSLNKTSYGDEGYYSYAESGLV